MAFAFGGVGLDTGFAELEIADAAAAAFALGASLAGALTAGAAFAMVMLACFAAIPPAS